MEKPGLEHPSLPEYRIPFDIEVNGQQYKGYLRPVDNRDPCVSYMVYIGEKWIGTVHHFHNGWHFDNEQYQHIKDKLGEIVTLWHG